MKPTAQIIVNWIDKIPWWIWGLVGIVGGLGALRLTLQGMGLAR